MVHRPAHVRRQDDLDKLHPGYLLPGAAGGLHRLGWEHPAGQAVGTYLALVGGVAVRTVIALLPQAAAVAVVN